MSKFDLQKAAGEASGVTFEESQRAVTLQPSIYHRLGESGLRKLSQLFYENVFADTDAQWFLNIFSSSTKAEAVENQYLFFVQTFGGPPLYQAKKGKYTRLVGRHANYNIGRAAADRWILHMTDAIQRHPSIADDLQPVLIEYFTYTAHYIVVASEYMRPDQLSGGKQIDPGRIW